MLLKLIGNTQRGHLTRPTQAKKPEKHREKHNKTTTMGKDPVPHTGRCPCTQLRSRAGHHTRRLRLGHAALVLRCVEPIVEDDACGPGCNMEDDGEGEGERHPVAS
jgi:hypothetical protein